MKFMSDSNKFWLILPFLFLIGSNIQSQTSTKEFPIFLQENTMDCGPVCLKMIAEFYDKKCSVEQLSKWSKSDTTGTSFLGLKIAADSLNFKTLAVKVSFEFLIKSARLPAIAYWNQNHFVVVYKTNSEKIWVADPAYGKRIYTKEKFLKYWLTNPKSPKQEGIVMLFESEEHLFSEN